MRKRIADLISSILNPFLVSVAVIILLSFTAASSPLDALKWALIAIALSVLPVFLVIVYLVRHGRLDTIFTNVREQRTKIYLVSSLCAVADCIILTYLRAPSILVAAFIVALLATLIFMCINLRWKISLHTAFAAASATILVILYGRMGMATVALIPLIVWARIELKRHSLSQAVIGALLAALIVVAVFYPLVRA